MWDVSGYLQRLKQRFTQWFNRRKGRRGVLWEERFKSVLVEGSGDPLSTMAAYIDLNPVRAGLVEDPKDYRWCGYGAAAAGDAAARVALAAVLAMAQRRPEVAQDPGAALATYRMWLFGQAAHAGWMQPSEANALNFVAAAVRAREVGHSPARLFVNLVRQRLGQNITQTQENRARLALVRFRELRPEGFRPEIPR